MPRSSDFQNGVVGHVVSMTLDHTVSPSLSVATCQCGQFQNKVVWRPEGYAKQDAAIQAHWREVSAGRSL